MRYYVELEGHEGAYEVELTTLPDGGVAAAVGGRPVEADVVAFSSRELSVRVGGRMLDLTVEGAPPSLGVVASGARTYVRAESERMRLANRAAPHKVAAEGEVRAPMPGRVVKVLVSVGDEVQAGSPVAIVEAMKMENEVRARAGGVVAEVRVAAGATVEHNAVLVVFKT